MAVVLSGTNAMFDAMVFGTGNRSGGEYVAQLNEAFVNNVAAPVLNMYQNVMQHSMFQTYREDALRQLKAIGHNLASAFQTNGVIELYDVNSIQHASTTMQRWIMACPDIRIAYHQNMIDGYSDTYEDRAPGVVGTDHYEYRCVTNGITMEHPDSDGEYVRYNWTQVPLHADDELTFDEQISVMYTWSRAQAALAKRKEDPTSKWGGQL